MIATVYIQTTLFCALKKLITPQIRISIQGIDMHRQNIGFGSEAQTFHN